MSDSAPDTRHTPGNFVGEWFGYPTYPIARIPPEGVASQAAEICPFLSRTTGERAECTKPANSRGVCTVTTQRSYQTTDWLVCPYRALDDAVLEEALRRLFSASYDPELCIPATALSHPGTRVHLHNALKRGERAFFFFNQKLGGELSVSKSPRSPEFAFDFTVVEIELRDGMPHVGRFGVLELQTMDFHGTYRFAVKNLSDALRLHGDRFPAEISAHPQWMSERIEGPNIANVFKRTFYQLALKFELGRSQLSTGCALAIPRSVWESWQPHLAAPNLTPYGSGVFGLLAPDAEEHQVDDFTAWILVFEIDRSAETTPQPLVITSVIGTNVDALAHYALKEAPSAALERMAAQRGLHYFLRKRLEVYWPDLAASLAASPG